MTSDVQGAHPGAHVHAGTVSGHAPADAIIISDAHLLFTGDFKRAGVDLVVSGDGHEVVLHDYFKGEKRAALASPDGAHLTGDIINALTGHTQFAQADGSASVAQVIGHVTKLTGTATAIRNGVSIILNQGDNVNKGDVVASGSDSTLGITFIDGTVFGLASNAKMVLNEMIYDPNGSDNKSLISLVQGTISFVAGATAKHGDMKVDTPVATMGIRGTAVLVEIDFTVPANGSAPPAKFQVLVEPDGTTGSYILFDKTTLTPIATVNQAGTQTIVNGQGGVNFLSSAQLSADAQKIITDVFALKFSDLNNPNTKQAVNFTDSITQQTVFAKTIAGQDVAVKFLTINVADKASDPTKGANPTGRDHIPGKPDVVTHDGAATERTLTTGSAAIDSVSGTVAYADLNPGDIPTLSTTFTSYTYQNAGHADVTATLTAAQLAAIKAVEAPLVVTQDPAGINHGVANWTYNVADSAFDFLAVGEVLTLTYTARVDNNFLPSNEFKEVTFTITITGTNDTPVITSSTQAAAIDELLGTHDSTTPDTATGTVKFTDADLTDTHAVTITGVAITGVTSGLASNATVLSWLSLGALTDSTDGVTGSKNWTFSAQDKSFDYLAVGETLTLTYTVQVDDHHGGVVTQPVTITITGTNDTPVITSGPQAATLEEIPGTHDSGTLDAATGTVTFTDLDLSDTHAVTIAGVVASGVTTGLAPNGTELGWLSLGALADSTGGVTGSKTWSFSAPDHYFDYLAVGEQVTLTYTVQVDDHHGGVVTQPVTITVTGTNDTPVITSGAQAATLQEIPGAHGSDTPETATGTVSFTDLDLSDTHAVTIAGVVASGVTTGLAPNGTELGWLSLGTLADSTGGVTGSKTWTFSAPDHYFDYLAVGEQVTLTYTVQVDDHHGGVVTQPVTITVTGTNDTPVITSGTQSAILKEAPDTHDSNTPDTSNGAVTFSDLDLSDTHDVTITGVVASDTTSGLALNPAVLSWLSLGTLTDSNGGVTGSKSWSFSAADHYFDYLADGEHVTLTYTVQVDDHHGGVVTQPVTITINGSNDAPVANADSDIGHIVEAGNDVNDNVIAGVSTTTGDVLHNDTDLDLSDTHSVVGVVKGTVGGVLSGGVGTSVTGLYGSLFLNANGTWTYTLDNNNPATNALAQGVHVNEVFSYTEADNHGGTSTTTLTIQITGTNDAPVGTNDAPLAASDINTGDPIVEKGVNPGNTLFDGTPTATGNVLTNDVDVDTGDAKFVQGVASGTPTGLLTEHVGSAVAGTYGSVTIAADGTWTYTLNNNSAATQALTQDQHVTDVFTYTMHDTAGATSSATLTIDVTGTNDAPVVVAALSDSANEGDASFNHNLLVGATDIDTGETATLSVANLTYSVDTGTASSTAPAGVSLGADGHTLTVDPTSPAFDHLAVGEQTIITVSYDVQDVHGATVAQTETITIHGTNDAPVVAAALSDSVNEGDASFNHDLLAGATDVDDGETATLSATSLTYSIDNGTASATAPAGISLDADGHTLKVDPTNSAFDHLAVGEQTIIKVSYNVQDVHGAMVAQTETITIHGTNDAPVVAAALSDSVNEGDAAFSHDLLAGATDVDHGETATLSVASLTYSIDGGTASTALPGGISLGADGHTLTVDPTNPAFDYLGIGDQTVIKVFYEVQDVHGATVAQTETITIHGINDAPSIVAEMDAPVQAVMVAPAAATAAVLGPGVTINSLGLKTETFDDQSVGHDSFHSTALNADFHSSGSAGVVHGSVDGVTAAPFFGPLPGAPDTTNYLTVGAGGVETITFASEQNAFGLYWGSVDSYNSVSFYDGSHLVASYSGASVAPLFADGNQGSFASNGYVEFSGLAQFNKVVLESTSNAFEIDNISSGAIHSSLSASVSGTLSVHDADIGDTLTGFVTGNGTAEFTGADGSTNLPGGANIASLIDAHDVAFESEQSDAGTEVLHWTYHPTDPDLDFLKAGDVLKIKFDAEVSDGHGHTESQPLTVTLVGANNATNASGFGVVNGTTGSDTFNNVGGNVTIIGNGGPDTFVFKPGFGNATIADFDVNNDTIEIGKSVFSDFADVLAHAHPVNANQDLVITDAASDTITLKGITASQLHASNFHLV